MKTRTKRLNTKANILQMIALGFAGAIFIGSFMLMLPCSAQSGKSIGFWDALFTATSAVCVTGLTVLNTASSFTPFGQIVILCLIQLGGLGFLSFTTAILRMMGLKMSLKERMLIRESLNEDVTAGMDQMIRWVLICSFSVEIVGAVLLSFRFVPLYGAKRGVYYAIFHAISAFCNAGFELFGDSALSEFRADALVNFSMMLMIVLGGLGFGVLKNLKDRFRGDRLRLQAKLVLTMYFSLMLIGFALTLIFEWNNSATLGNLPFGEKLLVALFHSVSLRTAGFAALDIQAMTASGKILDCLLMLIGAAPASTGGGIKVTTLAVIFLGIRSTLRGDREISVSKRCIPDALFHRAIAVASIAIAIWLSGSIIISAWQPELAIEDVLLECASAMGTVGLSAFGSASLNAFPRMLLVLTMYIGRIGPLSVALMLSKRQKHSQLQYPRSKLMIG